MSTIFEEYMFSEDEIERQEEEENKITPFYQQNNSPKTLKTLNDLKAMVLYADHTFQVSTGDRCRFPCAQFGYSISSPSSQPFPYSPYQLQDFVQVLNRYMHLEAYCDAVDDLNGPLAHSNQSDIPSEPDLFQALFFPRSIAPRTPMKPVAATQMTEKTLSAMWFRLVAHYFEWLAGISELQYFSDEDKIRLAVCQLCKVVCFSVVYANYECKSEEQEDLLFFGSGFYWDPARSNDPLMDDYCKEMNRLINQMIGPVRKVGMTKEEFILVKLIVLFDCTNLIGISEEGLEFARSMCQKYRTTLAQFVRFRTEEMGDDEGGWSQDETDKFSIERMRSLVDMAMGLEKLGKLDDDSLAFLVESNYGGMRGTLQQQIHTESRKIRRF